VSASDGQVAASPIQRPRATSLRTRSRILEAARALFNERGTAEVSTNHIAAAADVSPGNLYYHYADKRDIVRELHAAYSASHEGRWWPSDDPGQNIVKLRENLATGASLAWEYRFLGREVLALMRADPDLRAAYRAAYERRLGEWLAFGEQLVDQGLLRRPRPPRSIGDLTLALWLIEEGWLPFLDATGDPQDPALVARGNDLVLAVLDPLLTAKGRRAFEAAGIIAAPGGADGSQATSARDRLAEHPR
jgi:AcrR family transcriptional regulator